MINHTLWRPDTCGCEIVYAWDTEVDPAQRVHSLVSSKPCKVHADLGYVADDTSHYEAIKSENTMKNQVLAEAITAIPDMSFQATNENGDPEIRYRIGDYHWVFDADRKLNFALTRGDQAEKDAVGSKVNDDFAGKAVLKTKGEVDAIKIIEAEVAAEVLS